MYVKMQDLVKGPLHIMSVIKCSFIKTERYTLQDLNGNLLNKLKPYFKCYRV